MNQFSEDFLNYDDISTDINKLTDTDFSLTSPNSDSTGLYNNSLSPPYTSFYPPNDQYGMDPSAYGGEFNHNSYQTSQRGGTQIIRGADIQEDEKLLSKSKRIMKRNAAKERKKAKEETTFSLEGVDKKFIPEGFDDPNLDDKTRKKMIQMIRNRISAQNSRDRKKFQMQKLEDINSQIMEENSNLLREKSALLHEIAKLQENERKLYKELESLRQSNICSSCGRSSPGDFTHNMDENQEEEGLHIGGGLSNLSSPILNRFASGGKGFLTFFAFTTLLSLIVVMNYQQSEVDVMRGLKEMKDTRILEVDNGFCKNPNVTVDAVKVDELELALANSVVIKNIESLIENFDMNHELAFKSHLKSLEIRDTIAKTEEYIDLTEAEFQNAIVGSNYFLASNLRKPTTSTMDAKNLPILSQTTPDKTITSRLFCPSAFEFGDKGEKEATFEENDMGQRALDLEKSEYIQLFVPRGSIAKYNTNLTLSDLYGLPLGVNNGSEDTILEIWCKVFLVRELSTTL